MRKGLSTGYTDLDKLIRLAKGYLMVITGIPGMGKSEWLDAVLVNMSLEHGWKTLFYSPENHPIEMHMGKLAEKFIGKSILKFTETENDTAMEYLDNYFLWTDPEVPLLETLLDQAKLQIDTDGLDCLVIDPWNAVMHKRAAAELLHEYLANTLTRIIKFARDNNVLIAIVAHPSKPQKDKDGSYPVPTLYDISDGAMWRNKMDYGVVCHRPDMTKNQLAVYVQKIKQKWMGKVGMEVLDYDWQSGRFKNMSDQEYKLVTEIQAPF